MAVVNVNDHPRLTVSDELVIVQRDYEANSRVYMRSLSSSASCEITSGLALETLTAGPTTVTFPGLGVVQTASIPIGGDTRFRVTKITITSGVMEISIVSPSEFRSYLHVQTT